VHAVEDLGRPVGQHHGGDGAELLAPLDRVHAPQVLGAAGVAEQAAVAERPGPVLAAPLEPADDRALRQGRRHVFGQVDGPVVGLFGRLEDGLEVIVVPAAAQRRRREGRAPLAAAGGEGQGGTEGGARVAGGGLHPHVLERALGREPPVGDAVERDTAGQRDRPFTGPGVQPSGQVEHDLLEPLLHRGRQVRVHVGPGGVGQPRQHERAKVDGVHPEAAVVGGPDVVAEHRAEAVGVAVAGERHDLVLVGRAAEPEVRRHLLVQEAE
jgi:hypothetical protein